MPALMRRRLRTDGILTGGPPFFVCMRILCRKEWPEGLMLEVHSGRIQRRDQADEG